jgi:DNA repair exonuclease SbcCD nuclease subunit
LLKILHCADVHLETTFPEGRGGAARRNGLADAFARIVDLALARKVDALTIGGDLYESERAGPQTYRFLAEQFARFGGPVYVAPGNHDPYAPNSLLARTDLPENVRVFNEAAWRAYPLADGVTLWGFGHTPAEPRRPFANARFDRGGVQIALVHGSDEQRLPQNKRATAPFTIDEIVASGATFALVGHYHGGYIAKSGRKPVLAYPGSPEPIKFNEGEAHGAVLVTVEGTSLKAELLPVARTRALDRICDLTGVDHESAVFTRVEAALAGLGGHDYVRLQLTGALSEGTRLDRALLEKKFGERLGSLDVGDATRVYDYDRLAREPTVRGHVVRDLLEATRSNDTAAASLAEEALRYALAAFDGAEIAP